MSSREAGVFFFPVQALSPSLVRLRRKKQSETCYRCTVPNLGCSPFNFSLIDKVSENGGYIVVTVGHSPSTLEMLPRTIRRGGEVMWLSLWFRLLQKYRKGGKLGVFCISSLPPCWSFMLWPNELAVWKILLWQSIFGKGEKWGEPWGPINVLWEAWFREISAGYDARFGITCPLALDLILQCYIYRGDKIWSGGLKSHVLDWL